MSAPPPPSTESPPEPPVRILTPDVPVIEAPDVRPDASTFWKLVTVVTSPEVWSAAARFTVPVTFICSVLLPVAAVERGLGPPIGDDVVARTGGDGVAAAIAVDRIVAGSRGDDVRRGRAGDDDAGGQRAGIEILEIRDRGRIARGLIGAGGNREIHRRRSPVAAITSVSTPLPASIEVSVPR